MWCRYVCGVMTVLMVGGCCVCVCGVCVLCVGCCGCGVVMVGVGVVDDAYLVCL